MSWIRETETKNLNDYIKSRIDDIKDYISAGSCKDFSEYVQYCGELTSYQDVLNKIEEMQENSVA
jgi:hypothetical protein